MELVEDFGAKVNNAVKYINNFCNIGQYYSLTLNQCLSEFDSFRQSGSFK